jgi:1-piperideine-2-carboxylate/1-pyrroline-2-carboxylate reductase [NAD(P)H]
VIRQDMKKPAGPVLFKSCGWAGWDLAAARAALA